MEERNAETNVKIENLNIIVNEMPDGNVTGFYVQAKEAK